MRDNNDRNSKVGKKESVRGSRDLLLVFWDPLHISGMVKARNLKFCINIGHEGH